MADGEDFTFATPETIQLQRAYAKALLEHSLGGPPSGTSGNVTAVSPFGPLAQMSQALMGRMGADRAGALDVASRFTSANKSMPDLPGSTPGMHPYHRAEGEDGEGSASSYAEATAGQESGGDYNAIGPTTSRGDHAYGKYQVLGKNIPQWTYEALGYSMTPEQFLANEHAQDAVYQHKFGEYVSKYGPEGAARAWYGGEGNVGHPGARDLAHPKAPTVGQYGQDFMHRLAFSGEPEPSGNGAPEAVAPGSPSGMAMALAGGGGRPGPMAGVPIGGGMAPGLVPQRTPVTREQLIWSQASPYVSPTMKQMVPEAYYMQNQPIMTKNEFGQDVVIGRDGSQMVINPPVGVDYQVGDIHGKKFLRLNPRTGVYERIPVTRGGAPKPAPAATPAPGTPDESVPSLKFAPEGEEGGGLPPEITKGPEAAAAERGGMLTTPPPKAEGAMPFAETHSPNIPTAIGAGGQNVEDLEPEQQAEWLSQYKANQKAIEETAGTNVKQVAKGNEGYQNSARDATITSNYVAIARRMLDNPVLRDMTGPGANLKMNWKSFLAFLGNKDAEAAVGLRRAFEKVASSGIIGTLKSDYGGLGQIRNKEIELSEKATISPNNTVEANLAVLDMADRMIKQRQMMAKLANLYIGGQRWDKDGAPIKGKSNEQPTYAGMNDVVNEYLKNHPMYDDTIKDAEGKTELDHKLDLFKVPEKAEKKKADGGEPVDKRNLGPELPKGARIVPAPQPAQ